MLIGFHCGSCARRKRRGCRSPAAATAPAGRCRCRARCTPSGCRSGSSRVSRVGRDPLLLARPPRTCTAGSAAVALIVIDVLTLVERDAVEEHLHVGERVDRDADLADLAPRPGRGPSRSPSGSAGRRRRTAPSGPAPAGSETAGWTPRRPRSRRTAASSTGGRGTSSDRCPACTGTPRGIRDPRS